MTMGSDGRAPRVLAGAIGAFTLLLAACGSGTRRPAGTRATSESSLPPATSAVASTSKSPSWQGDAGTPAVPDAGVRKDHVRRADVIKVLSRGLPAFLAMIDVAPKFAAGHFAGWQIMSLGASPLWSGVDLAPNDVVVSVNGRSVEHPEEALTVWQSLVVAPELRVLVDRDGARRTLVYVIDD